MKNNFDGFGMTEGSMKNNFWYRVGQLGTIVLSADPIFTRNWSTHAISPSESCVHCNQWLGSPWDIIAEDFENHEF